MLEKGLLIRGSSWAVAFLLIGQDIQYVAYPTTAHSVQLCVSTVGTRYSSELLVLKVQHSRYTWTCRSNFPTFILCSWTFYATELMLLHNPSPLHQVRTIIHVLFFYYAGTYPAWVVPSFFQVLLVYTWTTTHVYGRALRLKMGVQIRCNTFRRQPLYPLSYWDGSGGYLWLEITSSSRSCCGLSRFRLLKLIDYTKPRRCRSFVSAPLTASFGHWDHGGAVFLGV